ncbi:hypothetical protein [Serratia sp. (in: enterobacteria)]|uniref:hypothetical protein n=1 Tax=Serratia sp. (in: enterobacteria) TaxID=616 RepID=UPI003988EB29
MKAHWDMVRSKIGVPTEFPDFSYNHYYNRLNDDEMEIIFLVPETEKDAIKAMAPKSEYLYEVSKR